MRARENAGQSETEFNEYLSNVRELMLFSRFMTNKTWSIKTRSVCFIELLHILPLDGSKDPNGSLLRTYF